ncbi:hypothetical protein EDB80DRAFT_577945, partial [Ilyonectria destructans]
LGTLSVDRLLGMITYFITEGNTPFLFYLKDIDNKGIIFNNISNKLINKQTGVQVPVIRKYSHRWFYIEVAGIVTSYFMEMELRRLYRRFGHYN